MTQKQTKQINRPWPSEAKDYQWKGTISIQKDITNILAHCKPRKEDVFLKIKETEQSSSNNIDQFTENTKNLINMQHPNLLTPIHAFVHKSQIWVVYPRYSGGPLNEVLSSHYPHGIPNESVVSSILFDIASGLHNLHKQKQCHRNIRAKSIHIDVENGNSILTSFNNLKTIEWRHDNPNAINKNNTMDSYHISSDQKPFIDPLILNGDEKASYYAADIYSFGITALQLTYGYPPPISKITREITTDLYDKKCPFSRHFQSLIKDCCNLNLEKRIGINKLIKHRFFRGKAAKLEICKCFSNMLKSTEKRIDPALQKPKAFERKIKKVLVKSQRANKVKADQEIIEEEMDNQDIIDVEEDPIEIKMRILTRFNTRMRSLSMMVLKHEHLVCGYIRENIDDDIVPKIIVNVVTYFYPACESEYDLMIDEEKYDELDVDEYDEEEKMNVLEAEQKEYETQRGFDEDYDGVRDSVEIDDDDSAVVQDEDGSDGAIKEEWLDGYEEFTVVVSGETLVKMKTESNALYGKIFELLGYKWYLEIIPPMKMDEDIVIAPNCILEGDWINCGLKIEIKETGDKCQYYEKFEGRNWNTGYCGRRQEYESKNTRCLLVNKGKIQNRDLTELSIKISIAIIGSSKMKEKKKEGKKWLDKENKNALVGDDRYWLFRIAVIVVFVAVLYLRINY